MCAVIQERGVYDRRWRSDRVLGTQGALISPPLSPQLNIANVCGSARRSLRDNRGRRSLAGVRSDRVLQTH